jgi:4-alpha-glucanotransferase
MSEPHESLKTLARSHGIALRRPCADGSTAPVSDQTLRKMLAALHVEFDDTALAPARPACYLTPGLPDHPAWGISLQLYELRSNRNWGIGDFADLLAFCDIAAPLGADFIGLNPLHAPFTADPARCSPYEPSNRRFLNPFYIAVDAVDGFVGSKAMTERIGQLRGVKLVDYAQVAATKLEVLRQIWQTGQGGRDGREFAAFTEEGGDDLHRHALFEALSAAMVANGEGAGWRSWPAAYQTPSSAEVADFSETQADDIQFHKWLQWLAHTQLEKAALHATKAGMRIGLYLDLAVGEALDGSATWSDPDIYVSGASIGNPPEPYATEGQDWRLAALQPATMTTGDSSPFEKLLAAAMRYAGAIRIDHAAALSRLFLVPTDGTPAEGTYVSYPEEALLDVLSKASQAYRSVVIGEDLGNIPEGLREDLGEAGILSYRILSYERNARGFIAPQDYPENALACVSTHDHQTFVGWWHGKDIAMRSEHGLVPPDMAKKHLLERQAERDDLIDALSQAGLQPPAAAMEVGDEAMSLSVSAYRYVARSRSLLVAVRLADLTNEPDPTNIPGTSGSYPNWRPKLSVALEALADAPLFRQVIATMQELRPR